MFLTADPDQGRMSLGYVGYLTGALACAAMGGWFAAAPELTEDPLSIALVVCLAVATIGMLVLSVRAERRAGERRLALFEEKLRESDERLRQAQKMEAIGQLAGGIAHDFNNLVTVIGCSVGLLSDATEPGDPRLDDLGQIKDAADRAAALTRQLLAFSRRQLLQPRPLDLNDVVREMEKMIRRVIGSHIAVHTTLDPKLGTVLADLGQMEQVLMNLAVNARDAMPSGGALMFATANRSVRTPEPHRHGVIEPGEYVTLTVRDSGQGMSAHVLEHLFEPFFTTKEQGKGTGLGLATVHGIVYQSGGHVTVESTPGVGSTFILFFPKIRGGRAVTPATGVHKPDLMTTPHSVLVVDDEVAILDISTRVLQQVGFRVLTATHGESAIQVLNHERNAGHPVELVLADVVMPVMDGFELTEIVAKEFPETRVLRMSGYARDQLVTQYRVSDDIKLVHKPFEVRELVAAVREAIAEG
jgi:signal transduction histidine kinase/CheY-like chemotaxis protein